MGFVLHKARSRPGEPEPWAVELQAMLLACALLVSPAQAVPRIRVLRDRTVG